MRTAIFAVTERGAGLALRTARVLNEESQLFLKEGTKTDNDNAQHFKVLGEAVAEAFPRYDALIFIMASGIAVRMIAPHLVSKLSDPAVVVMDEAGQHVISLLSGHVGGANQLTRELAVALGAESVITTATDVERLLAVDVFASECALRPWPKSEIKLLNSSLLEGKEIGYYIDSELPRAEFYKKIFWKHKIALISIEQDEFDAIKAPATLITSKEPAPRKGILYLSPRRLIAGVGCRRGVPVDAVMKALSAACDRIHRDPADISLLASTDVKSNEEGLLQAASALGKKILFWDRVTLQSAINRYGLTESGFVRNIIGVGNVCEAAALACVEKGRFALTKTKFGPVTVALIWEK